jgi:regulator of replication initiation timing
MSKWKTLPPWAEEYIANLEGQVNSLTERNHRLTSENDALKLEVGKLREDREMFRSTAERQAGLDTWNF